MMRLFLSLMGTVGAADPPVGGVSPLSWTIIGALVVALLAVSSFAKYWLGKMYEDLKECNAAHAASEEDILALLKVLRSQMERSKGGKPQ